MTGIIDCPDCGRTKLAGDIFKCCADEVEIIPPQQIIAEMRTALGACYTELAFALESAINRQDELAVMQIKSAQNKAAAALAKVQP